MSDAIDWSWIRATMTSLQSEQRILRGMIEPLPYRFGALEARVGAIEARLSGIEEMLNGIGLTLRLQTELLAKLPTA